MPVRIKLPRQGVQLQYARYWIDAGHAVQTRFWYVRGWLRLPAGLALALLLAFGLALFAERWTEEHVDPTLPWIGLVTAVALAWPVAATAGSKPLVLAVILGLVVAAARRGVWAEGPGWVRSWAATFVARFKKREKGDKELTVGLVLWRLTLGGFTVLFGFMALGAALGLVALLFRPY